MDLPTLVAIVRYERNAPRAAQAAARAKQKQHAKVVRSTIVTGPTEQSHDNAEVIKLFGKLMKEKAVSLNKPVSEVREGVTTLVFFPKKLGNPMDVFTFIESAKVTRESKSPLKFTIFGKTGGECELWLIITYVKKRYVLTYARHYDPGSDPAHGNGGSDAPLIRRPGGGVRAHRKVNGDE